MLNEVFLNILNMSFRAGGVALVVMALRLVFRKAPKWMLCLLWAMVAFRLIFPYSIQSEFSGMSVRGSGNADIFNSTTLFGQSGAQSLDNMLDIHTFDIEMQGTVNINPNSVNRAEFWTFAAACVWLAGMGGMLLYALCGWSMLKYRLRTATRLRENICQSECVTSPFVMGLFRPRIYLPYHMDGADRDQVILHEKAHIQRGDHVSKILAYALLAVYWFHPLMWIAYVLFCRDMERACDEKVISAMSGEERRVYASALLNCASGRHIHAVSPLAFGETGVKQRILSVMKYKKSAVWLTALVIAVSCAAAVYLLTDPMPKKAVGNTPLDYRNAAYAAGEKEGLTVIYCPRAPKEDEGDIQIGNIGGEAVRPYLSSRDWKQMSGSRRLPSPGSIEFVIENEYRVTIYDARVAKIEYEDGECWYRTRWDDYSMAEKMVLSPAGEVHALIDETGYQGEWIKCEVTSDAGTVYAELGAYEGEFDWTMFNWDDVTLLRVHASGQGVIRFMPDWEGEELIVGEEYYRYDSGSLTIEKATHRLTEKDGGGAYVLPFENKGNTRDYIAYFIEGEKGIHAMKIVFTQGGVAVAE